MGEILFKFLFHFFLAGKEGISSRVSQPEGVYFYGKERVSAYQPPASLSARESSGECGVGTREVRCGGGVGGGMSSGWFWGRLDGARGHWLRTHHSVGVGDWLEVLGLAQPPADVGQTFFVLCFLICKMGGVKWLWGKLRTKGRSSSPGS